MADEKNVADNKSKGGIGRLLIGGVIGGVIGLLFAPRKGSETRAQIAVQTKPVQESGKVIASKAGQVVGSQAEKISKKIPGIHQVKDLVSRIAGKPDTSTDVKNDISTASQKNSKTDEVEDKSATDETD